MTLLEKYDWTAEDEAAAALEGWNIWHVNSDQYEIQRVDETEERHRVFEDAHAVFICYDRALAGSLLHRKALAIVLDTTNVRAR